MYEGGRPRLFGGFMGSEELLELEAWGESDVGRCWPVGVGLPGGVGDGLCCELFRFEPTRFLKRVFMEFIRLEGRKGRGKRVGCDQGYLPELLRLTMELGTVQTAQGCVKESPRQLGCAAVPDDKFPELAPWRPSY